ANLTELVAHDRAARVLIRRLHHPRIRRSQKMLRAPPNLENNSRIWKALYTIRASVPAGFARAFGDGPKCRVDCGPAAHPTCPPPQGGERERRSTRRSGKAVARILYRRELATLTSPQWRRVGRASNAIVGRRVEFQRLIDVVQKLG